MMYSLIYTMMYTTKNISQLGGRLMKAMYINAPGQVEFRDIDKPVRQKGEVLLKLLYGGICGSDLGSYKGTFAYFDYPRIPGHEFSAEIPTIVELAPIDAPFLIKVFKNKSGYI